MAARVYISDTSPDLQDLRPIIIQQVRAAGMTPVWLDDSEKNVPDVETIIRQKLSRADCFISVISFLYGWQPGGLGGQSLAEREYQLARQQLTNFAIFMPDPDSPLGKLLQMRSVVQPPPVRAAQRDFWQRVQADGALTFRDETDLARQLTQVLGGWSAMVMPPAAEPEAEAAPPSPPAPIVPAAPAEELDDWLPRAAPAEPAPYVSPPPPAPGSSMLDRILGREAAKTAPPLPVSPVDVEALADQIADKTAARLAALQSQQQQQLAEQAVKVSEALRLWPGELVFGRPIKRKQFECDVFVIMPFAAEFAPVYTDVIRPCAAALNLRLLRGDELSSSGGSVMEEVWAALNACRFVIADISRGNDNVFYELGIAHTLNKPAILVTQAAAPEDVPFDIRHLRYVRYIPTPDGLTRLLVDLQTAASRLLQELNEWER